MVLTLDDERIIKYDISVQKEAIINNIDRITNLVFKLLPSREEGLDWRTPLENLIIEIGGMGELLDDQTVEFSLLCKMEGLLSLDKEEDFFQFRKTIFECLGLLSNIKRNV